MSLINEALKKAQRQRTGDQLLPPPGPALSAPGSPPQPRRVKPRKPPLPAATVVLIGVGGLGLIVVTFFATTMILRFTGNSSLPPPAPAPHAQVKITPAPAPAGVPTPTVSVALPPVNTPASTEPAVTPAPASTDNVTPAAAPTVVATPTPETASPIEPASPPPIQIPTVSAEPEPAPAPPPAQPHGPPKPLPEVYAIIDALRVNGIRASTTDPKVIMNDRLFRLNDVVDRVYGLKLIGITSTSLTFRDGFGATYTRTF